MSFFVLDTDHVTLYQRSHPSVLQRIREKDDRDIAVTMVTVEEQLRGWLKAIRRASSDEALILAYASLHAALDYFRGIRLLDFDKKACDKYAAIRHQKVRIGTRDMRIAAVALTEGAVLVTRNYRDFSRIPGLITEDWSQG